MCIQGSSCRREAQRWGLVLESSRNDRVFMPEVKLPAGSILVFDKGYHNFARWQQWTDQKINWVTRLIDNERVDIVETRTISQKEQEKGVHQDQRIILGRGSNSSTKRIEVRLVTFKDPESGKVFKFLTNNFRFKASTVAALYRKRWQIELFFKRLKQNSPLTFFLGDNENAIRIQIWCAFIADLLIKIVKERLKRKWAFANLSALIKHHLMNYLHLMNFLNNPDKIQLSYTPNDARHLLKSVLILVVMDSPPVVHLQDAFPHLSSVLILVVMDSPPVDVVLTDKQGKYKPPTFPPGVIWKIPQFF